MHTSERDTISNYSKYIVSRPQALAIVIMILAIVLGSIFLIINSYQQEEGELELEESNIDEDSNIGVEEDDVLEVPESYAWEIMATKDLNTELEDYASAQEGSVIYIPQDKVDYMEDIILSGGSYDDSVKLAEGVSYRLLCDDVEISCIIFTQDYKAVLWPGYVNYTPKILVQDIGLEKVTLLDFAGNSGARSLTVYEFDRDTGIVTVADSISAEFFEDPCGGNTPNLCTPEQQECFYDGDSSYASLSSYVEEGCFIDLFGNEPWFETNKQYLEFESKYGL